MISATEEDASADEAKVPAMVRKENGLGARRTQSEVNMPRVPSLPQMRPGRSKGPRSQLPFSPPMRRMLPSGRTISRPKT